MDLPYLSTDSSKACCSCSCSVGSTKWRRSLKRKLEQIEKSPNPRESLTGDPDFFSVARVEIENECVALRETANSQQQSIQELYFELEEERSASSSAANEAMSMILRLQREKAEAQMEFRQFKRFAEEKMAHDQQELLSMEELLYKKEQMIQSLNCEIQAYKHRLMSFGSDRFDLEDIKLSEGSFAGRYNRNRSMGDRSEISDWQGAKEINRCIYSEDTPLGRGRKPSPFDYPSLRCSFNANEELPEYDCLSDFDNYSSGATPRIHELQILEDRIYRLEQLDGKFNDGKNVCEKAQVSLPPRRSRYARTFSTDSSRTYTTLVKEASRECNSENMFTSGPSESLRRVDECTSDDYCYRIGGTSYDPADDTNDRIYTIDSVQGEREQTPRTSRADGTSTTNYMGNGNFRTPRHDDYTLDSKPQVGEQGECIATPRGSLKKMDAGDGDVVKKLYLRLHALEADRESMRQTIMSMQTDKVQIILFREIAQQLCKELTPEKKIVRKPHTMGNFSIMSVLKCVVSFVFRRKKSSKVKYPFGPTGNNVGLLLLLDRSPQFRHWRCITRAKA